MATGEPLGFPWTPMAPTELSPACQVIWRMAPDNLAQSSLQGWTLNINSNNSTAPQTEVEVVARHSYGRQLGRMSEALEALIEERHGKAPEDERFSDFLTMKQEIDKVKRDAAAARVERIVKDLALLKAQQDQKEYVRLRDALQEALK